MGLATPARAQHILVKVLVTTPKMNQSSYRPVADVMAASLIREFRRTGGMEILDRTAADTYAADHGWEAVDTRDRALEAAEALGADIVIYTTVTKEYDYFKYVITFLEVKRDIIQRRLNGEFRTFTSPLEIGRLMTTEEEKLARYLPLPSELADPGSLVRQVTVDPDNVPAGFQIEGIPRADRFGQMEQVFSYYRIFPGENEFYTLEQQKSITRLRSREDMDADTADLLNQYYMNGDFAIRHGLQAYVVTDVAIPTIALLVANGIPVTTSLGILTGYDGLSIDGDCIFKTVDDQYVDSYDLVDRNLLAVLIMVPRPGRYKGISRDYLDTVFAKHVNSAGKHPTLVEIKDSMFDIVRSKMND